METLNHSYFSASELPLATASSCPGYRIYLRAHLKHGYRLPMEQLRQDITAIVPALADLSYQQHITPLTRRMQVKLEQALGVEIKTIDVEVQYLPMQKSTISQVQKNHAA
ncbi:MAG: hypothetical protein JXQ97_03660 [Natronospirillum sp.]